MARMPEPAAPKLGKVDSLVAMDLEVPANLRIGQYGIATVEYFNHGETDIPAPILELVASGAKFRLTGETVFTDSQVQFLAINRDGPAGILAQVGNATLEFFRGLPATRPWPTTRRSSSTWRRTPPGCEISAAGRTWPRSRASHHGNRLPLPPLPPRAPRRPEATPRGAESRGPGGS